MFRRVLTSLSLVIGFLTFQAFANTMNFEKYELRPYVLTSYLNSENQAYPSYSIKYSFFEMTMDKIYYIYDKKNTNKVLYKFLFDDELTDKTAIEDIIESFVKTDNTK